VIQSVITADTEGNFSTSITLTEPGTYDLTAKGRESGATRTAVITVTDPAAATPATNGDDAAGFLSGGGLPANLANTGFPLVLWGSAGIGALIAGGISLRAVKRKAKESPQEA
jgi:hypothetical protein